MSHHVIIAGYPRAGTTLLYNMLRETVKGYETFDREMKAEKARQVATKNNIISKRPTDISDAPDLKKRFPDVQFLLCVRDPRSVLVSKHDHAPGQYKIGSDYALKTNAKKGVVGKAPGLIERHNRTVQVPNPTFVFYEDLVKDPNQEQVRLGEIFGFEYQGEFTDVHKQAPPEKLALQLNGVRSPETSRIEAWKDHPERIYDQFTKCPTLFNIVEYWGYEKDSMWFDEIICKAKNRR